MLPFLSLAGMHADARFSAALMAPSGVSGTPTTLTFSSVDFGPVAHGRAIVVLAWCGGTSTQGGAPSAAPTCTVGGVAAPRLREIVTWNSGGFAGVALFARAVPSGASGTVVVDWNNIRPLDMLVLRVTGYDVSGLHGSVALAISAGGTLAVPWRGLLLAASARRAPNTNAVAFSGVTRRTNAVGSGLRRNAGWDMQRAANAAQPVSFSPMADTSGRQACLAASFAPL